MSKPPPVPVKKKVPPPVPLKKNSPINQRGSITNTGSNRQERTSSNNESISTTQKIAKTKKADSPLNVQKEGEKVDPVSCSERNSLKSPNIDRIKGNVNSRPSSVVKGFSSSSSIGDLNKKEIPGESTEHSSSKVPPPPIPPTGPKKKSVDSTNEEQKISKEQDTPRPPVKSRPPAIPPRSHKPRESNKTSSSSNTLTRRDHLGSTKSESLDGKKSIENRFTFNHEIPQPEKYLNKPKIYPSSKFTQLSLKSAIHETQDSSSVSPVTDNQKIPPPPPPLPPVSL